MINIALLVKENYLSTLALNGLEMLKQDAKTQTVQVAEYEDEEAAINSFFKSLESSKKNGWRCVHLGKPNVG